MRIYSLEPVARVALVRSLSMRLAVMFGAIVLVVLAIGVYFILTYAALNPLNGLGMIGLAVVILGIVIGMRLVRQVKEYQQVLDSIRFSFDGEVLARHQMRIHDERIMRGEVAMIQENSEGLMVLTKDSSRYIFVPCDVNDFSELQQALGRWRSISKSDAPVRTKSGALSALWAIGTLACVGALLLSQVLWQVMLVGAAMIAVYILTYRMLRQQGSVDARFKRTYEGILLFLVIVFLAKVLMVVWPSLKP